MYCVSKVPGANLSLSRLFGTFDKDAVVFEIARAYREGDLAPSMPRCIVVDSEDWQCVPSVEDLQAIQKQTLRAECAATSGDAATFTSVFVAKTDHEAVASEVYMSLWALDARFEPQHHLVRSLLDAERVLAQSVSLSEPLTVSFARLVALSSQTEQVQIQNIA